MYNNIFAGIYSVFAKKTDAYIRALAWTALSQMFTTILILQIISKVLILPRGYFFLHPTFLNGLIALVWLALLGIFYNKKRVAHTLEKFNSKSPNAKIRLKVFAFLSAILPIVCVFIVSLAFR